MVNFYMKQFGELDNACGIIACLHACLNNLEEVKITKGSILDNYYQSVKDKTPEERAVALQNAQAFKE